jgi:tRNA(adenine34) deaminase
MGDWTVGDFSAREVVDRRLMARCIELSRMGAAAGERPFGSVVARGAEILSESANCTERDGDVSRHAEIVAIAQARKLLGGAKLAQCTLYTNVEPCPMCAFCIREAGIGRVVYALGSPIMGGHSRWNVLRDDTLSDGIPFVFGAVPEVVTGVLAEEAGEAWREWNPLAWHVIKLRKFMVAPPADEARVVPGHRPRPLRYLMRSLFRPGLTHAEPVPARAVGSKPRRD